MMIQKFSLQKLTMKPATPKFGQDDTRKSKEHPTGLQDIFQEVVTFDLTQGPATFEFKDGAKFTLLQHKGQVGGIESAPADSPRQLSTFELIRSAIAGPVGEAQHADSIAKLADVEGFVPYSVGFLYDAKYNNGNKMIFVVTRQKDSPENNMESLKVYFGRPDNVTERPLREVVKDLDNTSLTNAFIARTWEGSAKGPVFHFFNDPLGIFHVQVDGQKSIVELPIYRQYENI